MMQGECGSCFAIAVTDMVQTRIAIASNNTRRVPLSSQVVTCTLSSYYLVIQRVAYIDTHSAWFARNLHTDCTLTCCGCNVIVDNTLLWLLARL
jgi:hypothetical protein